MFMLKIMFAIIIVFFCFGVKAQSNFKAGYIVTNTGDTTYGDIDSQTWNLNPKKITFRQNAATKSFTVTDLQAFVITNEDSYIRSTVTYQLNPIELGKAKSVFEDGTKQDEVWLKVLYLGKYSLYELNTSSRVYFFVNDGSGIMEELVYRVKLVETNLFKDEQYKNRLLAFTINNPKQSFNDLVERTAYRSDDLKKVFVALNNHNGKVVGSQKSQAHFDVSVSIGYISLKPVVNTIASYINIGTFYPGSVTYKSTITFKAGIGVSFKSYKTTNHWSPRFGLDIQRIKVDGENFNHNNGFKEEKYAGNIDMIIPTISLGYIFNPKSKIFFTLAPFLEAGLLLNKDPIKVTAVTATNAQVVINGLPSTKSPLLMYGLSTSATRNKDKLFLQWTYSLNEIGNVRTNEFSIGYSFTFTR